MNKSYSLAVFSTLALGFTNTALAGDLETIQDEIDIRP